MTPTALALAEAERRLLARCQELGERVDARDDAAWGEYLGTVSVLNALIPRERRALMTTQEMASRLNISPRTVRKLGKVGKLEAVRLGKRGPGAIRWKRI